MFEAQEDGKCFCIKTGNRRVAEFLKAARVIFKRNERTRAQQIEHFHITYISGLQAIERSAERNCGRKSDRQGSESDSIRVPEYAVWTDRIPVKKNTNEA